MKRFALAIVVLLAFASFLLACPSSVTCPEDNMSAYFTGTTRTSVNGYLMGQYKCPNNHILWARCDGND